MCFGGGGGERVPLLFVIGVMTHHLKAKAHIIP